MRDLLVCVDAEVDAERAFTRDQAAVARTVEDGSARLRICTRSAPAIAFGRFHRMPAPVLGSASGCERRLTGGRAVAVGPGVLGLTLITPTVDWLDPACAPLRPDQVLNRALRPVLSLCRRTGIDAFYPGRDLVTANGRPLAHASFTVTADGVAVVEAHLALDDTFARFESLLGAADPDGVAAVARAQYAGAVSFEEAGASVSFPGLQAWADALSPYFEAHFGCVVRPLHDETVEIDAAKVGGASAHCAFLAERGAVRSGDSCAVAESMLGAVEVSARIENGCMYDLVVAGDLIAPFHTLDAISECCQGQPLRAPAVRRALVRAFTRSRSFVLGYNDFDGLIMRLCA